MLQPGLAVFAPAPGAVWPRPAVLLRLASAAAVLCAARKDSFTSLPEKRFGWVGTMLPWEASCICYSWIMLILGKAFIACHDKQSLFREPAQKPL